jgi:dihydroflavonol-4-reductase
LKTAFITGATGFVGSHLARRLLANGWRVRALVRRPDRPGQLPASVDVVPGDLNDPATYKAALADCERVFHVAGLVKARTRADYFAANADGTEAVVRAAAEVCPAAMFVLVSSQAAAGPSRNGQPVTDADAPRPVSWYGESKLEGERRLERYASGPWYVVRPSVVYGPGDPGVLAMFQIVQKGIAPILAGGRCRVQLIAVEDLVDVLVAAAGRPDRAGHKGFAATDTVSTGELFRYIAGLRNPPARTLPVPGFVLRVAGAWESLRETVTGRSRPFNRDKAREMLQPDWLCDPIPTLRELDIRPRQSWEAGIRDVCRWYVASLWLRPSVWAV